MVAFHKMVVKPSHFALFWTKTVHYYLDFFTCLDLYCIHINCITLEVLIMQLSVYGSVEIYRSGVAMKKVLENT